MDPCHTSSMAPFWTQTGFSFTTPWWPGGPTTWPTQHKGAGYHSLSGDVCEWKTGPALSPLTWGCKCQCPHPGRRRHRICRQDALSAGPIRLLWLRYCGDSRSPQQRRYDCGQRSILQTVLWTSEWTPWSWTLDLQITTGRIRGSQTGVSQPIRCYCPLERSSSSTCPYWDGDPCFLRCGTTLPSEWTRYREPRVLVAWNYRTSIFALRPDEAHSTGWL